MKFQRRQLVAAMAGLMLVLSAGAASAMGGPVGRRSRHARTGTYR